MRPAVQRVLAALLGAASLVLLPGVAPAGGNDLSLLHLCPLQPRTAGAPVPECTWVRRAAGTGLVETVALDQEADSRFRSLMSELAVVLAPRLLVPAQTLGLAGFQVSAEVGTTSISADQPFWNGVRAVSPQAPTMQRPSGALTTVGLYFRKGLWIPFPGFETGAGVMHLTDSHLLSWQAYAKAALHEGFTEWPLPSLAVRGSAAYLTGSDEVRMTTLGLDVIVSKAWGLLKTARFEPFGGWSYLWIHARALRLDATPGCDAWAVRRAGPGDRLGDACLESQRGTGNDSLATFAFSDQDAIRRHRFFGGAKLRFSTVFVSAQYELVPVGRTRDERKPMGARDRSGQQRTLSASAGFDF